MSGVGLVGCKFMGRAHPMERWWPPGHVIGYEHIFVHTVKDLMDGIRVGGSPAPNFEDGFRCQAVAAVERSVGSRGWTSPEVS